MVFKASKFAVAAALIGVGLLQAPTATAQSYDQLHTWCFGNSTDDQTIQGCDAVIKLNPNNDAAFTSRGVGYDNKGQYDRAIQDYDQAIKLNPNSGYAFNNRGNSYNDKGQYDRAIQDLDQAIKLNPNYAVAFNNRGNAYNGKGQYDRAIADYNRAIQLDPKYALAYSNRGVTYFDKGDNDRAIADFNQAIQLDPKYMRAYFGRGLASLYAGTLPKALADFNQASALDPKNAYAALWLDIVGQRSNVPSRLTQAITAIDMTAWPTPVIRMFLGQMPPEAVLAAADDPDAVKKKSQVCEANFYSGELALRNGTKDKASRLFRLAAADCPKGNDELSAAHAELKALGMTP
jgi:lipoprotein NlpI